MQRRTYVVLIGHYDHINEYREVLIEAASPQEALDKVVIGPDEFWATTDELNKVVSSLQEEWDDIPF